jgi:nicotinate phosphoribosyltransferase
MANGYLKCGTDGKIAVFDLFFREREEITYAVAAGLEQAIEYLTKIEFRAEELDYLRSLNCFDEDFLKALSEFKFTGDVYAMPEGTIVYPTEPLMTVKAPLIEAQLIETALLTIINHQTLIATKASKMVSNTDGGVLEFGLRRAQGPDAGIYGARASIIGGCIATSNVLAGKMFDIPVKGTHSHSWVMSFKDELTSFRKYAELYPNNCLLLVDTYDTLESGVPNAIKVFDELKATGHKPVGIRLDSGDLAYLSITARKMLDEAGHTEAKIFASGDIDEDVLISLKAQGARIDVWGIGTKLITSYDNPSLGGVYKLSAIEEDGELIPKLKISDTVEKITNPGLKKVIRFFDKKTNMAIADLIMLKEEPLPDGNPYTIFHPDYTWKRTTIKDYYVKELMKDIIIGGEIVYDKPALKDIARYAKESRDCFWEQYKRIHKPEIFKVDLSDKLYALKQELLTKNG